MEFVDIQDVVGNLIPNAYVNKITLESSGDSPSRIDPHIDDPTLEESISTGQNPTTLKIRVDISVKEAIINQQASWLKQFVGENFNFNDLFTIKVKQFFDQQRYRNFNFDSFNSQESLDTKKTLSDANAFFEIDDKGNRIYSIPYSFNYLHSQLNPQFLAYICWVEIDIQKLVDALSNNQFSTSVNPQDLGIPTRSNEKYEIVINNGQVISKSHYYETEEGQIWTGPVHQMPNGQWMTGESHSENDINLNRVETTTSKVQDFRQVDRAQKRIVDLTRANEVLAGIPNVKRIRDANVQIKTSQKAFSNLFMSRDSRNNINGNFSIDFALLVQNNTDFPALWNSPFTATQVLNRTSIKSIELKTIRLEGSPEAKSPVRYTSDDFNREASKFIEDNGPVEEIIGIAHPTNNLIPAGQNDTIMQFNADQVYVRTELSPTTFMYAFRDIESPKKTDRYFQYKVVVEFKDGAVEYLEEVLQDLEQQKKNLEDYLFDASKLGTSTIKNPYADPHTDPPEEGQDEAGRPIRSQNNDISPGNFNAMSNRFTQDFILNVISPQNASKYVTEPRDKISLYQAILSLLSSGEPGLNFLENSLLELRSTLMTYLDPRTGTISSINSVISICDSLIESISSAIKVVRDPRTGQGATNISGKPSMGQGPNKDKIVRAEYTFPDIVSTNPATNTGIDILNPIEQQEILRTVDIDEFNSLFEQEVGKIYTENGFRSILYELVGTDVDNAYSYYTPNYSYNYGPSTTNLYDNYDPGSFRTVSTKSKFGRGTTGHYGNDAAWLFQEYGLYAVGSNEPSLPFSQPFQQANNPSQVVDNLQAWTNASRDSSRTFNSLSEQVKVMSKDFPTYANQFSQQLVSDIESPQVDLTRFNPGVYNSPTVYRDQFLQLPIQLQGIILYKSNIAQASAVVGQSFFNPAIIPTMDSEAEKDEDYYAIYEFKFTKIYRIEYFTGFGTTSANGVNYSLNDNWRKLTKTVIDSLSQENKILFCRFREYNNSDLEVRNNPEEEMPLVQRYFYISPNGELLEPTPPTPPLSTAGINFGFSRVGF